MGRVINIKILSGLPASGKTTWSVRYVRDNRNVMRINRDELRKMLVCNIETEGNKNIVDKAKLTLITTAIDNERDIILDDTHCYHEYLVSLISIIRIAAISFEKEVEIEVMDFTTNVDVCVERNNQRDACIPLVAIYHMCSSKKEINYTELNIDKYTVI